MIRITLNGHQKDGKIIDHRCQSNSNNHFTLMLLYAAIYAIESENGTVTEAMKKWDEREAFRLSQLGIEKKNLKSKEEIIAQGSVPGPGPGGVIKEDIPQKPGHGTALDGDGAALKEDAKDETAKADTAKKEDAKDETAKADTAKADTAKADTAKADTAKK